MEVADDHVSHRIALLQVSQIQLCCHARRRGGTCLRSETCPIESQERISSYLPGAGLVHARYVGLVTQGLAIHETRQRIGPEEYRCQGKHTTNNSTVNSAPCLQGPAPLAIFCMRFAEKERSALFSVTLQPVHVG